MMGAIKCSPHHMLEICVLLISPCSVLCAGGVETWSAVPQPQTPEPKDLLEVEVQVGGTAFLPCPAASSGHNSPVWVRRRDYHILTGGKNNYIKDQRFHVLFDASTSDWTLQIKFVNVSDNGTYECQVSSGSGYVSWFVRLHVFQPVASIPSGPEYHVQQGTAIQLICVVQKSPTPPNFVLWYHGDAMVNYDKQRGGVSVETEQQADAEGRTLSRLNIADATPSDSGNYSCQPSNTHPASVWVFVSKGDKIAAIQRKNGAADEGRQPASWLLPFVPVASSLLRLVTR